MHRFWGGDDSNVYTELVNPYFISLEKSKSRVCPTCGSLTYLEPSAHSPNVVMERCPECGALGALVAPEWAEMDEPTQGAGQQGSGTAARKGAGQQGPAEILQFKPRS